MRQTPFRTCLSGILAIWKQFFILSIPGGARVGQVSAIPILDHIGAQMGTLRLGDQQLIGTTVV
jgi:hypothetical protein